jgi:DNA-binding NarL/FixJ family response regulator
MSRTRLLLADDHIMVAAGMRMLLAGEFDLVGAVEDGRAVLRAAEELRPDVILLDISMPRLNGIEACRQLVKLLPNVRIIFLTMHADPVYVEEALRAGAVGYLLKRSAASELSGAINMVMRGGTYITPVVEWKESATNTHQKEESQRSFERLTPRQYEVLHLLAEGRANKEIAALLHISEKTVDYHKAGIKAELRLGSTAELTQFAIKHRIIEI